MARPKGFAPWSPQPDTEVVVAQVPQVLDDYREHLPQDQAAYDRLDACFVRARRAGMISFEHIRDDGVTVETPFAWDSGEQLIETFGRDIED